MVFILSQINCLDHRMHSDCSNRINEKDFYFHRKQSILSSESSIQEYHLLKLKRTAEASSVFKHDSSKLPVKKSESAEAISPFFKTVTSSEKCQISPRESLNYAGMDAFPENLADSSREKSPESGSNSYFHLKGLANHDYGAFSTEKSLFIKKEVSSPEKSSNTYCGENKICETKLNFTDNLHDFSKNESGCLKGSADHDGGAFFTEESFFIKEEVFSSENSSNAYCNENEISETKLNFTGNLHDFSKNESDHLKGSADHDGGAFFTEESLFIKKEVSSENSSNAYCSQNEICETKLNFTDNLHGFSKNESFCKKDLNNLTIVNGAFSLQKPVDSSKAINNSDLTNSVDCSENTSFCKADLKHLTVVNGEFLLEKPALSYQSVTNPLQPRNKSSKHLSSFSEFESCRKKRKKSRRKKIKKSHAKNNSKYFKKYLKKDNIFEKPKEKNTLESMTNNIECSRNESFHKKDLQHLTIVDGTFLLQKPTTSSYKPKPNQLHKREIPSNCSTPYLKLDSCYRKEIDVEVDSKYSTDNTVVKCKEKNNLESKASNIDCSGIESFHKKDLEHLTIVNGAFSLQKPTSTLNNKSTTNQVQKLGNSSNHISSCSGFDPVYKTEIFHGKIESKYFIGNTFDYSVEKNHLESMTSNVDSSRNEYFHKDDLKHLTIVNGAFLLQKPTTANHKSATNQLQKFENSSDCSLPYPEFGFCGKTETDNEINSKYFSDNTVVKSEEESNLDSVENAVDCSEKESFCKKDLENLTIVNGAFSLQKPSTLSHKSTTNQLQKCENFSNSSSSYSEFDSCCKTETFHDEVESKYFAGNTFNKSEEKNNLLESMTSNTDCSGKESFRKEDLKHLTIVNGAFILEKPP